MTDNNTTFEKKELRYSLKAIKLFCVVLAIVDAMMIGSTLVASEGDLSVFFEFEVLFKVVVAIAVPLIFVLVMLNQRSTNVLYYGKFGFSVAGKTYAFSQVTELKTVHRGRWGTYYHIYVDDEIVFKFSLNYENKDDFIALLQDNGVRIHA